jgi:hypothetical protein
MPLAAGVTELHAVAEPDLALPDKNAAPMTRHRTEP